MTSFYKVYLSSTVYPWWDLKNYRWKQKLINLVKKYNNNIRFIDPLKNKSEDPAVCPMDITDINRSDFVVVYINKLSIGTLLELGYCIFTNKKYCIVSKKKYILMHPWIRFLCKDKIYTDIRAVSKLILKKYYKFVKKINKKKFYGNKKTNKNTKQFTK
jgi:hypothetical protein